MLNGLYAAISFILSMDHFESELIQHECSLIHGFHIKAANIILIIVVCTNHGVMCSNLSTETETFNCSWRKKVINAVLRRTTLNILILSIYMHPNAWALLERSLTKDIPCFLPAMLLVTILSICLAVRSFNKNQESFLSISTLVITLAIFAPFIPRSFLIMLNVDVPG